VLPNLTRQLALTFIIPLMVMAERFSYYGTRSIIIFYTTTELGVDRATVYEWYGTMMVVLGLAPILGGVLAIATGPYIPLVLGAIFMAAGALILPWLPADLLWIHMALMVLGSGLYKPAAYATVVNALPHPFTHWRDAVFVAAYGLINLGALLAPMSGDWLSNHFGYTAAFMLFAVVNMGVLLLAAGLTGVHFATEDRAPIPEKLTITAPVAGVALAAISIPMWASASGPWTSIFDSMSQLGLEHRLSWIFAVNPLIIFCGAGFLTGFLVGVYLGQLKFPTLAIAGGGLFLIAIANFAMYVPLGDLPRSVALVFLIGAVAVAGMGELVASPLLMSRIAGDAHWRSSTLLISLWLCGSAFGAEVMSVFPTTESGDTLRIATSVGFTGLLTIIGLVLLVAGWPIHRTLYDPSSLPDPVRPLA